MEGQGEWKRCRAEDTERIQSVGQFGPGQPQLAAGGSGNFVEHLHADRFALEQEVGCDRGARIVARSKTVSNATHSFRKA